MSMKETRDELKGGSAGCLPSVSVVVVTKGNRRLVERAVESILKTDYPSRLRQIVVLEETDDPQPLQGEGVSYHAIPLRHLGVGYARNEALRFATHDIVAFTDDDCVVERSWLHEIVRPFEDSPEVAATAGSVRVPECGPVGQCENVLGFPGGGVKYVHASGGNTVLHPTFSTCNCAIRRSSLSEQPRFDQGFLSSGEDELLSRRISARHLLLYNPLAVVYHEPRDSVGGIFRWFVRRGQARVEMVRHVDDRARYLAHVAYVSPFLRLSLLIFFCLLVGFPVFPVVLLVAAVYHLSIMWRYRWAWRFFPSLTTHLILPWVKLVMDIGMDVGIAKTLLRPVKREK
jgi:cellulose synthase/poly-beta-1,6-N-acetylglucosamine synthase-like glycosyltransferase